MVIAWVNLVALDRRETQTESHARIPLLAFESPKALECSELNDANRGNQALQRSRRASPTYSTSEPGDRVMLVVRRADLNRTEEWHEILRR